MRKAGDEMQADDNDLDDTSSPSRSKSPGILKSLAKGFRRKSETKTEDPIPPYVSPPVASSSTHPSRPYNRVEVSVPRLNTTPAVSPPLPFGSPTPMRTSRDPRVPQSPYPSSTPAPSAQSLTSFSSAGSYSSGQTDYNFEFENLQIQFRASQENLRIAREQAEAQRILFERDRTARELRHQQELEALRRELSSDDVSGKGKRRRM